MIVDHSFIQELRQKIEIKRADFARMLGISDNYLYCVERGTRKPSLGLLERIAVISGMPLEKFVRLQSGQEEGEPDGEGEEGLLGGARVYAGVLHKLRRERHARKATEDRNAELERINEHLQIVLHFHMLFEDILCEESLSRGERMQKIQALAKATGRAGEVTFPEMQSTLRVKRAVLRNWLRSEQRIFKCLLIEDREVVATTPGEASLRLCCFDCDYYESRECCGYGEEKRPENIITLVVRLEANGVYNRTEQARILEESYGITISGHQISEIVYRSRYGLKMPEGAFNLESNEGKRKR